MRDDKGIDDKIVAVCVDDPAYNEYMEHTELPSHTLREMMRFFQDYKVLEHKEVVIDAPMGAEEAIAVLRESLELYRKLRRGEIFAKSS
jgi:inorganic pyrophosphatase